MKDFSMLFKKIKFLYYFTAAVFLCTFSAESFDSSSEREMGKEVGSRVAAALGELLSGPREEEITGVVSGLSAIAQEAFTNPDFLFCLLSMPQGPLSRDSIISRFVYEKFPDMDKDRFKRVLEHVVTCVHHRNSSAARVVREIIDDRKGSIFDLTPLGYGLFQMGCGIISAVRYSDEQGSYFESQPGHKDILEGLRGIYDLIQGTGPLVLEEISQALTPDLLDCNKIFSVQDSEPKSSNPLDRDKMVSLSHVYLVFSAEKKEADFLDWYKAAMAHNRLLTPNFPESSRILVFQFTSQLMEKRINTFISFIGDIPHTDEARRKEHIFRADKQIQSYAYSHLFFFYGKRSYEDGTRAVATMRETIYQMYKHLSNSAYAQETLEAREVRFQSFLEKSRYYSNLKASFLTDGKTPNLTHWFWGEIIFTSDKMQEFRRQYP